MSFLRKLFGPPNVKEMIERKDTDGLIKALKYKKDAKVRRRAAEGLGKVGDPAGVEALIEGFSDDDNLVPAYARMAVVEIGAPAEAALKKRLQDPSARVRSYAEKALKDIQLRRAAVGGKSRRSKQRPRARPAGRPRSRRAKIKPATKPPSIDLSALSARMRSNIKPSAASVEAAIAKLGDKSFTKRRAAVKDVVKLGGSAVPHLIALLKEEDRHAVNGAIKALEGIGDPRAVKPLIELAAAKRDEDGLTANSLAIDAVDAIEQIGSEAVKPLLSLLESANASIRREAARALGRIGDGSVGPALQELLSDEDADVRETAIVALKDTAKSEAVDPLVAVLKSDDEVRWRAAQVLGTIGDVRAVDPLVAALADSDDGVSSWAAVSLGEIGEAGAVEALVHALEDENANVRGPAAAALGRIGDSRAIEPLIDAIEEGLVKGKACAALARLKATQAAPAIIPLLEDENERVRSDAADALGELGDLRAVEPLICALQNEGWEHDWSTNRRVVQALGKLGDPRAREALDEVLTRYRRDARALALRVAAVDALVDVAGREIEERLIGLANDKGERSRVNKAAEEGLKRIAEMPEPAPQEPTRPDQRAARVATVSETLDSLDAILEPPLGEDATLEQEQAYLENVRVKLKGEGTVGFWIPDAANAEVRLRFFQSLSLVTPPKRYRVAPNRATERGGYFLMFDEARAPGESDKEYQAAMGADRELAQGNVAAQRGNFQDAVRHFRQAAKGQPYSPEAWNNQAVALARLNRNEEAIECCDRAIELKPDYADAWDIKGRCLGRLRRFKEAIPVIERYIELASANSVHRPRVQQARRALQRLKSGN
jgi:HEAT repeat protein